MKTLVAIGIALVIGYGYGRYQMAEHVYRAWVDGMAYEIAGPSYPISRAAILKDYEGL